MHPFRKAINPKFYDKFIKAQLKSRYFEDIASINLDYQTDNYNCQRLIIGNFYPSEYERNWKKLSKKTLCEYLGFQLIQISEDTNTPIISFTLIDEQIEQFGKKELSSLFYKDLGISLTDVVKRPAKNYNIYTFTWNYNGEYLNPMKLMDV
jgi:hypothetical protein